MIASMLGVRPASGGTGGFGTPIQTKTADIFAFNEYIDVTFDDPVTPGSLIVGCIAMGGGGQVVDSASLGTGNEEPATFINAEDVDNQGQASQWYVANASGDYNTFRFVFPDNYGSSKVAQIVEFPAPPSAAVTDAVSAAGGTVPADSGPTTVAAVPTLFVGFVVCADGDTLTDPEPGFTILTGPTVSFGVGYQIVPSPLGTYSFGYAGTGHGPGDLFMNFGAFLAPFQ